MIVRHWSNQHNKRIFAAWVLPQWFLGFLGQILEIIFIHTCRWFWSSRWETTVFCPWATGFAALSTCGALKFVRVNKTHFRNHIVMYNSIAILIFNNFSTPSFFFSNQPMAIMKLHNQKIRGITVGSYGAAMWWSSSVLLPLYLIAAAWGLAVLQALGPATRTATRWLG